MKKLLLVACLTTALALVSSTLSLAQAQKPAEKPKPGAMMQAAKARMDLRLGMRGLWTEHVVYTRNYIISALADLPDADAIAQRLLRNQDDIGNAVKPFYGDAAGSKLTGLLRAHIMIATEVVKAAKMGNTADLTSAQAKWTANADEIAAFLAAANPQWVKQDMQDILHKHLELTTGECVSRLKKDWAADIDNYDKGYAHMMMFADRLTMGIERQFPDKFKM